MAGTLVSSSRRIAMISRRARWAPRQKCGPAAPKPTCGLGDRVMSNRSGSAKTCSSRLAHWYISRNLSPSAKACPFSSASLVSVRRIQMTGET
jgi:hypothetical protein